MYVRLLKHHNGHKPGRVLCMSEGAANAILRRPGGVAEEAKPAKQVKTERTKNHR